MRDGLMTSSQIISTEKGDDKMIGAAIFTATVIAVITAIILDDKEERA